VRWSPGRFDQGRAVIGALPARTPISGAWSRAIVAEAPASSLRGLAVNADPPSRKGVPCGELNSVAHAQAWRPGSASRGMERFGGEEIVKHIRHHRLQPRPPSGQADAVCNQAVAQPATAVASPVKPGRPRRKARQAFERWPACLVVETGQR